MKNVIAKITVKELREFIYENYYKKNRFYWKRNNYLLKKIRKTLVRLDIKLTKKIPDPSQRASWFIKKKKKMKKLSLSKKKKFKLN